MLEREAELAAIAGLLRSGAGTAVIEGAAGIGKSSLLDVACREADASGYVVVRARGSVDDPRSDARCIGHECRSGR